MMVYGLAMSEEEQLAARVRAGLMAYDRWDIDSIVGVHGVGAGLGFGFRTRDVRPVLPTDVQRAGLKAWFGSLDRYKVEDVETNCSVDGDIATVWGFYTEDFQHHGGDPERVRARYSMVFHRRDGDWQIVWNHRDIQDFSDDGRYLKRPPSGGST
jgi:hypothetical protein